VLKAALIGFVLALAGGQPALACSLPIMPYPVEAPAGLSEEEERQYWADAEAAWERNQKVWQQYRVWNQADAVFVAKIEALPHNTITVRNGSGMQAMDVRDVVLLPLQWLKGEGEATPFQIGPKGFGSCGPAPWWPAINGAIGDLHVIYVAGGSPAQETVLDVIPIAEIVEFETRSRLPYPQ
jgi:hypothetical protein